MNRAMKNIPRRMNRGKETMIWVNRTKKQDKVEQEHQAEDRGKRARKPGQARVEQAWEVRSAPRITTMQLCLQ